MSFLVAAPPESGWQVDPEQLAGWLTDDWPGARTALPFPAAAHVTALEFEITIGDEQCPGRLSADRSDVTIEASLPEFARFAVWLRDRAGWREGLVAYRPALAIMMELRPDTTVEEIEAGLAG